MSVFGGPVGLGRATSCESIVNEIEVQKKEIYTGFLVDIELFIEIKTSRVILNPYLNDSIAALILGHVIHKNKSLRDPCRIIFEKVVNQLMSEELQHPASKVDNDSKFYTISGCQLQAGDHFPIDVIYEVLNFEGILDGSQLFEIKENKQLPSTIYNQYAIKFLFTPAIDRAWPIYTKKGYEEIEPSRGFPEQIMDEIESKKDFDHKEIWSIICMMNIKPSINFF